MAVIDELHSFMGSERGKQLQSQLTRIERVIQRRVCRIGLSATLGDMNGAKEFLRPNHGAEVELIEAREKNQELMVLIKGVVEKSTPPKEDQEKEEETADLIAKGSIVTDLFKVMRGSNNLVFPNSRSSVEFFADRLRRRCEEERVPNEFWPHHGNLSKEIREQTEAALKQKEVPATAICTSTLELGIDIGAVKSVAQIGPPPSVASLRQRLGRSGRRKGEPAILRGYAIERQLTVQSGPSDQLRAGLVQSIAMVRLLTRGWRAGDSLVRLGCWRALYAPAHNPGYSNIDSLGDCLIGRKQAFLLISPALKQHSSPIRSGCLILRKQPFCGLFPTFTDRQLSALP